MGILSTNLYAFARKIGKQFLPYGLVDWRGTPVEEMDWAGRLRRMLKNMMPHGVVRLFRSDRVADLKEISSSLNRTCDRLRRDVGAGKMVKTVFLVTHPSMFPAKPLFAAMLNDDMFDPFVAVIPDLRWRDRDVAETMESCRVRLARCIPE